MVPSPGAPRPPPPRRTGQQAATTLVQGDRTVRMTGNDVMPPITVTTTYRVTDDPSDAHFVYSRVEHPLRERVEEVIGSIEGGYAVLYATGLSAAYAAVGWARPNRVLLEAGGYHGIQLVMKLAEQRQRIELLPLTTEPRAGDLVWLETPRNPDCRMQDIRAHVARAHKAGARVAVDATFAPPPMLYALQHGADIVMHAATKFYGGHSDLLSGVLIVRTPAEQEELRGERLVMGNVPGNLETWLLLRSLRTMELRVRRQCETANKVAAWLAGDANKRFVKKVMHLSLPSHPDHAMAKEQLALFGSMMAIEMHTEALARDLPPRLQVIQDATSLGGVESLIDWRYKHDQTVPVGLLRFSVGLEAYEDLVADFAQALAAMERTVARL